MLDININKEEKRRATHKQILKIIDMVFILTGKTVFNFKLEDKDINLSKISDKYAGYIIGKMTAKIKELDKENNKDAVNRILDLESGHKYIKLLDAQIVKENNKNVIGAGNIKVKEAYEKIVNRINEKYEPDDYIWFDANWITQEVESRIDRELIFNRLVEDNIVYPVYGVRCLRCHGCLSGWEIYESILDVESYDFCDNCDMYIKAYKDKQYKKQANIALYFYVDVYTTNEREYHKNNSEYYKHNDGYMSYYILFKGSKILLKHKSNENYKEIELKEVIKIAEDIKGLVKPLYTREYAILTKEIDKKLVKNQGGNHG